MERKRSKPKVDHNMSMVHPNAVAIDIWATMYVAAVRADCTSGPVRSFGTSTADVDRLVGRPDHRDLRFLVRSVCTRSH
jgi:hypothetical protein